MSQFVVLLKKELLESWRNFKWIWMPLTFILLGVMDPITQNYLPKILDTMGDLPEGAVIQLPVPSAEEVISMSLANIDMLGILILVLASMGIIAGERKSGVAAMILVKPVSHHYFVMSKWLSSLLLMWISLFLGLLASWYYTGLLFEFIPFSDFLLSFVLYGIWLSLVITITIFYNAFLKTPGLVGFISLATIIILNMVSGILTEWLAWSPARLMSYASQSLMQDGLPENTIASIVLTVLIMIVLLFTSVFIFRKKELAV
ncbi:ABC transporter permease [Pseudoneobacillus rhizosphaerae]|uniref:Transmembrane protein YxlG n=1 Tax=Pseudoneobacillus rhizosphaerae TaxID=2880968 RepID=A0A9C7LBW7_9BACI|nr:ABC transporter permease subunit [Pseudoneobacillus rhizosphaerae]CAG9609872.1 putative transmembrane protein YxlG [Pseudoneobacillus rhizosphaerae]